MLETKVLILHLRQYTYYFFLWFCDWLRILASPFSLLVPTRGVLQLVRNITKFQQYSNYSKGSQIDSHTQRVVDHIFSLINPVQPAPCTPPKRKMRTAQVSFSRFYSDYWKVSTVPFEQAVFHLKTLVADYNFPMADMDSAIQQAIFKLNEKQDVNYSKLDKKFESLCAILESFMASNRSSSPKPKLLQPPLLSLHSEPFIIPS